ncbi:MAG: adenosylcobinamide-GDP ribazoletransferase [Nitrospirae bacterium]|nr:MAG: adenosylcobinamide-GDP ribazoletransferase [Nitrospirota bacterium]
MLNSLRYAFSFLTILPLPFADTLKCSEDEIGRSTSAFALVGLLRGVFLYWIYLLFKPVFVPEVTALVLLTGHVLINGGFHLDGLSDSFDALASRKDSRDCLRIMKESTSGPAGVTALVIALLLKAALLTVAVRTEHPSCLVYFPMAGAWAMVVAMFYGKPARGEGLGYIFIRYTGRRQFLLATFTVVLIPLLVGSTFRSWGGLILCLLFTLALVVVFHRRFGGLTGDTLGAIAEINEIIFLMYYLL